MTVVGVLSPHLADDHLDVCIKALLTGIEGRATGPGAALSGGAGKPAAGGSGAAAAENPLAAADPRTLIQTIGTVSRCVGFRLGKHLHRIVPLLLRVMGSPEEGADSEQANELRENVLQAFESFVLRSPREVSRRRRPLQEAGAAAASSSATTIAFSRQASLTPAVLGRLCLCSDP